MRYDKKRLIAFMLISMILITLFSFFRAYNVAALDADSIISSVKDLTASLSEDTATPTDAALTKYAKAGMFGNECMIAVTEGNDDTIVKTHSACKEAQVFIESNEKYSQYAAKQLRTNDSNASRLNAAMEGFNENAHFVYSFLTGFGCLSSLLVFILIFVRITWLPEHATQRRKAMEDILVAGVSTVLLGGFWLLISVFQSMFNRFWVTYTVYSKDWKHAGNAVLAEYKTLIIGILGVATLTAILMFIKSITGIVVSGATSARKSEKMMQVLYCGLASAGLGAITIFAGFFWNILQ